MAATPRKTLRIAEYTSAAVFVFVGALVLISSIWEPIPVEILLGLGALITGANLAIPRITLGKGADIPSWLLPMTSVDIVFGILFITGIGRWVLELYTLLGEWAILRGAVRIYSAAANETKSSAHTRLVSGALALLMILGGAVRISVATAADAATASALLSGALLLNMAFVSAISARYVFGEPKQDKPKAAETVAPPSSPAKAPAPAPAPAPAEQTPTADDAEPEDDKQ